MAKVISCNLNADASYFAKKLDLLALEGGIKFILPSPANAQVLSDKVRGFMTTPIKGISRHGRIFITAKGSRVSFGTRADLTWDDLP